MTNDDPESIDGCRRSDRFRLTNRSNAGPRSTFFTDETKGTDGLESTNAVGNQPGVLLEVVECATSGWSEDPVRSTTVKTNVVQAPLQISDVVAPQHWRIEEERPVSELPACFDDREPRWFVA